MSLDLGTLSGKVELDVQAFDRKYADVDRVLTELERRKVPDVKIDADTASAERAIDAVEKSGQTLARREFDPKVDADITKAEANIANTRRELEVLQRMEATPKVKADITRAQRSLGTAESRLRALQGLRAEMVVEADTSPAVAEIDGLGAEGKRAGADAGEGLSDGIKGALVALPIAGAVVLAGAAIGKALFDGIQDGLAQEQSRDLFSARTGLDANTARVFARAAGDAYAGAFGESVEGNLDAARQALQQGLIDEQATQSEIQNIVEHLTGITDVFEYDIPQTARAVGQMLKTGLVADAEQAFDLIARASQGAMSDDLMDTLVEYSGQFETVGLDGADAMGLIRQAMDEGARDTDKVADAVKEMGIRIREGTDPAREALENLGVDVEDVITGFQQGGPQARDAMRIVFDALRETKDEGGNVQEVIAALFGGPGEDLGAALFALDLDTVTEALGETDGAARTLLDTLGDNAATQVESAQRNIELAADGIKGALASAFSDDIAGAAEWVQRNRGPIMEFLLDAVNAGFDLGGVLIDVWSGASRAIGGFIAGPAASLIETYGNIAHAIDRATPGDQGGDAAQEWARETAGAMRDTGDLMTETADIVENEWGSALDDMQVRVNEWAGPEIMNARVHDAVLRMEERMDEFSAFIDESGGTVTINGDKVTAEEALAQMVEEIDESGGFVTIDGETVPADDALDALMAAIEASGGDVTVDGDTSDAKAAAAAAIADINGSSATLNVYAKLIDQGVSKGMAAMGARYAGQASLYTDGYAEGGYTGDLPVDAVAGAVHGQEFVFDADTTAKYRPLFEAIHAGNGVGIAAAAPTAVAPPPSAIYVQNPFTGEYLLAQVASVAGRVTSAAQTSRRQAISQGGRR